MKTDRLLSGADAAALLNISDSSFWRLVNAGRIPKVDLSGTGKAGRGRKLWQFRESDLWGYVEANTGCARPPDAPAAAPPLVGIEALRAAGWDEDLHLPSAKKGRGPGKAAPRRPN